MRVPPLHLVADRARDLGEGKRTLFFSHARMEHDLEQQVTQFIAEVVEVAPIDRVGHFIGFFDRIGGDGGEVLFQVPGTATLRVAQARHDGQQPLQLRAGVAGGRGFVRAHAFLLDQSDNQSRHGRLVSPSAMKSPFNSVGRRL